MKDKLLERISRLRSEAEAGLGTLSTPQAVRDFRVRYLGRRGEVTGLLKQLGSLGEEDRPAAGKVINELKSFLESRCGEMLRVLEAKADQAAIGGASVDISLPPRLIPEGKIHPLIRVMNELIGVFTGMGFSVYEGPEVETDFYNFEALNQPKDHPARDMHDTFYIDKKLLLRTHTSPVQIRMMEKKMPPIFMIGPGIVYRRDTPDPTHSPVFQQVEGLMVDKRITFGDLKGVLNEFVRRVFGNETATRFRPSFFPFTEPSAEMEIKCVNCRGKGCRVCKESGWLEILGCGMVDPNVFEAVNYNPKEVTGFAFGMGVERVAMLKYNINDIRLFYENNVRFLEQF